MFTARRLVVAIGAVCLSLVWLLPQGHALNKAPGWRAPSTAIGSAQAGALAMRPASATPGSDRRLTKTQQVAQAGPARVSVKLRKGVSASKAAEAGKRHGFKVVGAVPQIGWTFIESTRPGEGAVSLATRAKNEGLAEKAIPEQWIYPTYSPTDPLYESQWGFENTGQSGGTAGADARFTTAWDWSRGAGVVVAVVDTGVDLTHPDLMGQGWTNTSEVPGNGTDDDRNGKVDDISGWDFYRNDASVYDEGDGDKHGTHVAGTIAAAANSTGGAGGAPAARIMPLKFLGPAGGSDANGAAAIVYAVDEGAQVVNASWGGGGYSQVLVDALAYADSRGVLVVCAAGNAGTDNDASTFYPAAYPAPNIISVAATDRLDRLAPYSNFGATTVDVGAPGSDILSSQPRLPASLLVNKSPYKVVYHAFPVESILQASARQAMISGSLSALDAGSSTPILVVDDSWAAVGSESAGRRLTTYTAALANAGYTSVSTWRTDVSGAPSAATMSGKTVIWFTGAASYFIPQYQSYGSLSSTERSALGTFLTGGGRLLLSSGDLGYDMTALGGSALTWYRTYLHAEYADDDPWTGRVHGTSGALSGIEADVSDPLRHRDGFDDISPYDTYAAPLAHWDEYATISGTSMAAPHVSAAIALMRSRLPNRSAAEYKSRILSGVRPNAQLSGKTLTGGVLDATASVGRLAAPASLTVTALPGRNVLSWTDSPDPDLVATRVLAREDAFPGGPDDPVSEIVYEGKAGTAVHADLLGGRTLNYAAYSKNALGTWTTESTASATTRRVMTAENDSYQTLWNRALVVPAPGVLGNDTGDSLSLTLDAPPSHGMAAFAEDGGFSYRPSDGYSGVDTFSYRLTDGFDSTTVTVTVEVRPLRLDALSTLNAGPGSAVTFTGVGFGDSQGNGYVSFAGVKATVTDWSDTSVTAIVPSGAQAGWAGISQSGRMSNGKWFKPFATPVVTAISPGQAAPGSVVTISGSGFGSAQGAGYVSFAGTRGTATSWSDTSITVLVPPGAAAGYAGVYQNGMMSNGKWFRPFLPPRLDSLSVYNGAPGTIVKFTGSNFGVVQGSGSVSFAGTSALVLSWSDTEISAVVPSGAKAGYAGVIQNGLVSNGKWFKPFNPPIVSSLSRYSGAPGSLVTITGQDFGSVQGQGWVIFAGTSAEIASWTDTSVTVFVPMISQAGYVGVVQNGVCSNGKYFIPLPY